LIELGAYKPGTNAALDKALHIIQPINQLLLQDNEKPLSFDTLMQRFKDIVV
jgi:flagellar biosynthesis/type III secretory pathway ATPase